MSTAPAPVKPPSRRDYENAVANLRKLTNAPQEVAQSAYEEARFHFPTAKAIIEAKRRVAEETALQAEFQQVLLLALYDARIRPALRRWHYYEATFDPMRRPDDRFRLWQKLIDENATLDVIREGEHYTGRITTPAVNGAWRSGEGISSEMHEAIILAWWQAFEGVA